jgi:hypothetical protein
MKTAGWFSGLVTLPDVIVSPGEYVTRSGEHVTITSVSTNHDFNCRGVYNNGITERWHKSGRIFFGQECQNDIVSPVT